VKEEKRFSFLLSGQDLQVDCTIRSQQLEYPILIVHHLFGFQFIAFFNVDGFPWPSVGRGAAIRLLRTALAR
jgi:hypothetical protein